ncbi:WXG100 family type VII secretion target [Nocardioides sp. CPCC 206347]|uniref:WXG100 family type VII secretion target n=1 Tax=unclassified Nocardioides TaxID=2615069 RepID=UPI00360C2437
MTEYDYYSDYTDDTELKLEDIQKKIEEGVQKVIDTWNDSIIAKGLDSRWAWVVSPGLKAAYEWAKGNLEDEIEKLWDDFEKFCEDLWDTVSDITGDPWVLMQMNQAYITAAGRIRDEKRVVNDITARLANSWSGDAFTSYDAVVKEQVAAINGVDLGLKSAATACAEGALQIRKTWRDCIDVLLDVVDTVLDGIKDGTDAGQWVTFDAGPAIKVIGKALTATIGYANTLEGYFDENVTVKLSMWTTLNSGLDGLDANNDWPTISGREIGDISDSGGYTEKD